LITRIFPFEELPAAIRVAGGGGEIVKVQIANES
jgi:hypothetical protein